MLPATQDKPKIRIVILPAEPKLPDVGVNLYPVVRTTSAPFGKEEDRGTRNLYKMRSEAEIIAHPSMQRSGNREISMEEEGLSAVYRLRSKTTGKSYIGQAKLVKYKNDKDGIFKAYRYGPKGRLHDHVSEAKQTNKEYAIFNAIRKLGPDDFELTILGIYNIQDVDLKEQNAAAEYNSFNDGYNTINDCFAAQTDHRLQEYIERYGSYPAVSREIREKYRIRLQDEIDYTDYKTLIKFLDYTFDQFTFSIGKGTTPERDNGEKPMYQTIKMKARIAGTRRRFESSFGGRYDTLEEKCNRMSELVKRIPKTDDCEYAYGKDLRKEMFHL